MKTHRTVSLVVAVNYAAYRGQCYLNIPSGDLDGKAMRLRDLIEEGLASGPGRPRTKATDKKLEIHFIAFYVNKNLFGFLKKEDNGYVVEATNQEELKAELKRIFEKHILLEGD